MNKSEYTGQSIVPLAIITLLFFTFGFVTNLNGILMPHLKLACQLSDFASAFVPFAFFSAYFLFSLPSGWIIKKTCYKSAILIGLLICATGALLFVPAANTMVYIYFLIALSVLAAGITLLQVAANPYVSLLGKPEYASSRISLMGVFNSLGATIAPLVGGLLILNESDISNEYLNSLSAIKLQSFLAQEAASVKMPYVALALYLVLISTIIYFLNLPPISTVQAESSRTTSSLWKNKRLMMGVIAIFMYVGAEVSIADFMIRFAQSLNLPNFSNKVGAFYVSGYGISALIGRVIGIFVLPRFKPATAILMYTLLAIVLVLTGILSNSYLALWCMMLVGFSNSVLWPCIFPLAIKDLGKDTERGSSLLIMAVVGGAFIPLLVGWASDNFGIQNAYWIPLLCYAYIFYFGYVERNS